MMMNFQKIKEISKSIDNEILILFWQLTIKTLEELDIVSNQNLSIEMFLMKLMHLSSSKPEKEYSKKNNFSDTLDLEKRSIEPNLKNDAINQIKNIIQEKKIKSEIQGEIKAEGKILINSFNDLLNYCTEKKRLN